MDQRVRFIAAVAEAEEARSESFASVCRRFGISRRVGYKWAARYDADGLDGLKDKPRAPHECPHRTPHEVRDALIELRKEFPQWGPKKLRVVLLGRRPELHVPSPSAIGAMLKSAGLIRPPRRRVRTPPSLLPLAPGEQPNDLWCVDFKGHFALGDKSRCYPLTITDHVTRYLLKCEGLAQPRERPVRQHFERAFREFGLPSRIRSDNGPPFASTGLGGLSALSVWWMKLGITPERIEPGQPQQNGRHERMHKTLKAECSIEDALPEQQRALDRFRGRYNDVRPHEALDGKTPTSRYSPSHRPMPEQLRSPEYPEAMKVRRLDPHGSLCFGGKPFAFCRVLAGEPVGLELIEEDTWEVFYGSILLAEVRVRGVRGRQDVQVRRVT
jgi:transposase InsO family protein